jgi:hypothetical protein
MPKEFFSAVFILLASLVGIHHAQPAPSVAQHNSPSVKSASNQGANLQAGRPTATTSQASGRVAGLRDAINRQILLKADLAMKGLPTEPAERSIEILQWSLKVIESAQGCQRIDGSSSGPSRHGARTRLEQVRGEAVSERMRRNPLRQPGQLGSHVTDKIELARGHWADAIAAREHPQLWARDAPPVAQQLGRFAFTPTTRHRTNGRH